MCQASTGPGACRRPLRTYLAILLLFSLGNSSDAFLLLRAKDLRGNDVSLPLLWTVFHVAKLLSSHVGGGWSDRIERPKLIVSVGWSTRRTYLAFGIATEPWHALVAFHRLRLYYGLTEAGRKGTRQRPGPADLRGRAYGILQLHRRHQRRACGSAHRLALADVEPRVRLLFLAPRRAALASAALVLGRVGTLSRRLSIGRKQSHAFLSTWLSGDSFTEADHGNAVRHVGVWSAGLSL